MAVAPPAATVDPGVENARHRFDVTIMRRVCFAGIRGIATLYFVDPSITLCVSDNSLNESDPLFLTGS